MTIFTPLIFLICLKIQYFLPFYAIFRKISKFLDRNFRGEWVYFREGVKILECTFSLTVFENRPQSGGRGLFNFLAKMLYTVKFLLKFGYKDLFFLKLKILPAVEFFTLAVSYFYVTVFLGQFPETCLLIIVS